MSTRDLSKTVLFEEKLKKLYGEGKFEAIQIEDYTAPEAYADALKGDSSSLVRYLQRSTLCLHCSCSFRR